MTQAELAGPDFTKGFISLIETGRSGLSLRAARIMAPRLGVTVDDLLRPERTETDRSAELTLLRAEAELAAGRPGDALRTARPVEKAPGELRSRYLRLKGRVSLQTDKPVEAVAVLGEALRGFRATGQKELAARTLFDLALAHGRNEAHAEALSYGLQCESAINARDVVDASLEMRVLSFLAGICVTLGDQTGADLWIERAKRLAEDVVDPRGVANLYENLSVARQREGDPEAALHFARKALAAYEQLGASKDVGSTWNTIGWIYIQRRQFERAAEALDRSDEIASEIGDGRLEAYILQSKAELALARGKATEALELAQASIDHPQAAKRARATSLLVRAQALAQTDASANQVIAAFDEAAKALQPHGRNLVADAYRAKFEALVARGRPKEANEAAEAAFAALRTTLS